MIRILLADDQTLVRQGIQTLLDLEEDLIVVGAAANGQQALTMVEQMQPDVVLMDVRMPVMDGVAATGEITKRWPHIGVIILTTFDDDEYVIEGLKAGARGYMLKDADSSEIVEAVRIVARGEALIQPSITRKVLAEFTRLAGRGAPAMLPLAEPLTEREMDVLRGIAIGQSNREIADQLCISEGTVKNHVSSLLAKLAVRDRTQAIIRARKLGLIE
ncbi:response regulator transcription factor [uncultured Chloroflexus sp.]|uniref:response regulator transcription factor n=1 Tax=uncultured Chloroflexus sp. TaxID=214040 RepID=UPI00260E9477|nr:response regulator transcription factor [uncultured Chloroflexus sp.]